MENFISVNIQYLLNKGKVTQDNFGGLFGLGKGVINQYLLKKSNPKIETIQRICAHFEISIDDFVNTDLSIPKPYGIKQGQLLYAQETTSEYPVTFSPRYVESLEKTIQDKEVIIQMLKEKLQIEEKSRTA